LSLRNEQNNVQQEQVPDDSEELKALDPGAIAVSIVYEIEDSRSQGTAEV
jgi:hypothetical protein